MPIIKSAGVLHFGPELDPTWMSAEGMRSQNSALVLVAGGGLLGGADAARTPLADSLRAMLASLDTLFGLHNHEP